MTVPESPLRLLLLQHAREGTPGLIGEAIAARDAEVDTRLPHEGDPLPPSPEEFDGLVLMGGLMSALDDDICPHFPALMNLIRAFPETGRPVLGVCLGAQLIARAWGADVHLGSHDEFGFFPLVCGEAAQDDPVLAELPERMSVMQWHGDSFVLPEGATLLLCGEDCANQALRIGDLVYGFQCHFEATGEMVRSWTEAYVRMGDLEAAPVHARLEAEFAEHGATGERLGRGIARRWLDLVENARRDRLGA